MQERHERATPSEPHGSLAGGVAAADDSEARPGAELSLGRPRGVEDRQPLELRQALDREPAVLSAGRQKDGARGDLPVVLEPHDMPAVSRLEGQGAVGRRGARPELPRLCDRPACQLGAADPCREAEVVLDPAG